MSKRVGKTEFEVFLWKFLRQFPTTYSQTIIVNMVGAIDFNSTNNESKNEFYA